MPNHQRDAIGAGVRIELVPVHSHDSVPTTAPLLCKDDPPASSPSPAWPLLPSTVQSSRTSTFVNALLDTVLSCLSRAFLAFALAVRAYDGSATSHHPELKAALSEASQYVGQTRSHRVDKALLTSWEIPGTERLPHTICLCNRSGCAVPSAMAP